MTHPFDTDLDVGQTVGQTVGRRAVVATVGLTGLALAVPLGLHRLPALLGLDAEAVPAEPTRSAFVPHVGATFSLRSATTQARADLVAVDDLSDDLAGDEDSFVLRFRSDQRLEQDAYDLIGGRLTTPAVLLVPGVDGKAATLTAVFNNVRES